MKLLFVFFLLFCSSFSDLYAQEEEKTDSKDNSTEEIESLEEDTEENTIEEKSESDKMDSKLREMAKNRATFLQKELKLTNYTSRVVQKTIYEYSLKANKIIQSEIPEYEKTRSLSRLIYYQNKKMKEILNVDQFYQYVNMRPD